ncbi:MAG: glycosyltransferase family 4 protein, partial [Acidobacteriaceae bacterium]|nr:glycosyltransferase family 4 protein [Acidobacteriaceae bacterium]
TAMLEAMSYGVPVVATSVGGTCEAVNDGITGLLVPPFEAAALASRIVELLNAPQRARDLGCAGQQTVKERFTKAHMIDRYAGFYEKALEQRRGLSGGREM